MYGDKAPIIEGNCDTTLYLGRSDFETNKAFSEQLGKYTEVVRNRSESHGRQGSYSDSETRIAADLLSAADLTNNPDKFAGDECLVFIKNARAFKDKKYRTLDHPRYHELKECGEFVMEDWRYDQRAFCSAAALVDAGADPAWIALNVYQSQRPEYLRLKGLVMKRLMVCPVEGGAIGYSFATQEDLDRCGVSPDECDGLIDIVRSVGGVDVCLFLRETGDGKVRGNLRSKSTLDVSRVAEELGGGGHVAAAGFTYSGGVEEALGAVLPRLRALISEGDAEA